MLDAVKDGADCGWRGTSGFGATAMHAAAIRGHSDLVDLLAQGGCGLEHKDSKYGRTPLIDASFYGNLATVQALLKAGSDIEATDNEIGRTALSWAAFRGHAEIVNELLAQGADCNAADLAGKCPVHCAAGQGYPDLVETLIGAGSIADAQCKFGRTALHYAAQNTVVQELQAGERKQQHAYDLLVTRGWNKNLADGFGNVATLPEQPTAGGAGGAFDGDALSWDQIHLSEDALV
eukprot:TRINITY_DN20461_c0_g1_i3.p1 TRINITY_DN20461_c0_g1~~TRINITY_DN20461_c0_g1_i3.p1  ORF type:complete len:235 (+),score=56.34 TRINITY_DN20461_c0_g1_i3:228-932(+)